MKFSTIAVAAFLAVVCAASAEAGPESVSAVVTTSSKWSTEHYPAPSPSPLPKFYHGSLYYYQAYKLVYKFPAFYRSVSVLSASRYRAMVRSTFLIFAHCVKIEKKIAEIYYARATGSSTSYLLYDLKDLYSTKTSMIYKLKSLYGVSYSSVPFFGTYRYSSMNRIPAYTPITVPYGGYSHNYPKYGHPGYSQYRKYGPGYKRYPSRFGYLKRAYTIYIYNLDISILAGKMWCNVLLGDISKNYSLRKTIRSSRAALSRKINSYYTTYHVYYKKVPFYGSGLYRITYTGY